MAQVLINETTLTNIADAIREKSGATDTYKPSEMAPAIQELTITDTGIEDGLISKSCSVASYTNDRVSDIGPYAFYQVKGLQEASFPNVTSIGLNAFDGCSDLTNINLPLVDLIRGNAFANTTSLTEVTLPKVTYLPSQVFRRSGITTLNAPLVENIGAYGHDYSTTSNDSAFGSSKIANLNLPKLTNVGPYCFNYCSKLTAVDLPSLTNVYESGFASCSNLTTVNAPKLERIEKNGFKYCGALSNVTWSPCGPVIEDYAFSDCDFKTLTFNITSNETSLPSIHFGYKAFANNPNLTSVKIISKSGLPAEVALGGAVFSGCENLTSVVIKIPTMTDSSHPITIRDDAFANCPNLTSIKVSWSKAWQEADGYLDNAPWGATNATVTYNYTGS